MTLSPARLGTRGAVAPRRAVPALPYDLVLLGSDGNLDNRLQRRLSLLDEAARSATPEDRSDGRWSARANSRARDGRVRAHGRRSKAHEVEAVSRRRGVFIGCANAAVTLSCGVTFCAVGEWSSLTCAAARLAATPEPARHPEFKKLEENHVFFFAGPCSYTRAGALGDAALWMHPDVERSARGGASPNDTGALERGHLRPWHTRDVSERWAAYQRSARPIVSWRKDFGAWLGAVYRDPARYLETGAGRRDSGFPDRGDDPDGVFASNGPNDPAGADRRAWTWELRIEDRVALDEVEALLLPRRLAEDARAWRKARAAKRRPQLFFIERDTAVGADDVFRESERVCRSLVET
ncbi:MAG: hypothetical protein R3A48_04835 [Polyangiales bacterium]